MFSLGSRQKQHNQVFKRHPDNKDGTKKSWRKDLPGFPDTLTNMAILTELHGINDGWMALGILAWNCKQDLFHIL